MNFFKNHAGIAGALIIGGAVIVGAFIVTQDVSLPVAERVVASPTAALREQVIEKDSDGDGLRDWEEELWGTDPFKVDTDGDGVLDGDFVRNRVADKEVKEIVNFEDLNFTQQFSREFFAEFLQARADGEITPAERERLLASLLSGVDASLPRAQAPSALETTVTSEESVSAYVRTLAQVIINATPEGITESELDLLERGLEEKDPALLEEVSRIGAGYKELAEELRGVVPPSQLRSAHASLITASARLSVIIESFGGAFDDALLALAHFPSYEPEAVRLSNAVTSISDVADTFILSPDTQTLQALEALGL